MTKIFARRISCPILAVLVAVAIPRAGLSQPVFPPVVTKLSPAAIARTLRIPDQMSSEATPAGSGYRVPGPFGREIIRFNAWMIWTRNNGTFGLIHGGIVPEDLRAIEANVAPLALKTRYRGILPSSVTSTHELWSVGIKMGSYLGIWPHQKGSMVGYFAIIDGEPQAVVPLAYSTRKVHAVDEFPNLHDLGITLSMVRQSSDGSAELINIPIGSSVMASIGKPYGDALRRLPSKR